MCRNHSHLTVKWSEEIYTSTGPRMDICVEQPLTLDYLDGRKVMLGAGAVLSILSSQVVDLLRSVVLPTGEHLDSMSPLAWSISAATVMEMKKSTAE